ncbi:MAG: hypothetical protein KC474_08590 [Cyanobacteria bacterium HKST-UBA04]|nr:hypothetical protein [Cyanobacteria bacterium HKST-UBA04]
MAFAIQPTRGGAYPPSFSPPAWRASTHAPRFGLVLRGRDEGLITDRLASDTAVIAQHILTSGLNRFVDENRRELGNDQVAFSVAVRHLNLDHDTVVLDAQERARLSPPEPDPVDEEGWSADDESMPWRAFDSAYGQSDSRGIDPDRIVKPTARVLLSLNGLPFVPKNTVKPVTDPDELETLIAGLLSGEIDPRKAPVEEVELGRLQLVDGQEYVVREKRSRLRPHEAPMNPAEPLDLDHAQRMASADYLGALLDRVRTVLTRR